VLHPRRLALIFATAALGALAAAPAANAATGCDAPTSKPFAQWLDYGNYQAVPGGSFENGPAGWTVTGSTAIVAGNEPWKVGGAGDAKALSIPNGATATSPATCAGLGFPTFRYFLRKTSGLLTSVRADVLYLDEGHIVGSLPLGLLGLAGSSWSPGLLPSLTLAGLPLVTGNPTDSSIALRFTAVGGNVQIDDVYIDPYSRTR